MEQVSQEILPPILLSLARSTTRVQKSHLFNLVCKRVPFLPLAGCALVKVAVAQTQVSAVVYSLHPRHRRRWGAAFSQTKQSSSTSALWDHAEMEATWNPSNPIVHLRMWGQRMFFGDKKLLLGKKCQKFFHPASETLRQTSDRVQSPDGHTVGSEDSCGS